LQPHISLFIVALAVGNSCKHMSAKSNLMEETQHTLYGPS
jgi:hypothetical protein